MKKIKLNVLLTALVVMFSYASNTHAIIFSAAVTDAVTNGGPVYDEDGMIGAISMLETSFWLAVSAGIALVVVLDKNIPAMEAQALVNDIELFEADETIVGPTLGKLFNEADKNEVELNLDRIYEAALLKM